MRATARFLSVLGLCWAVAVSCRDSKDEVVTDIQTEVGEEVKVELPTVDATCERCHVLQTLGEVLSDEQAGIREWASSCGQGLIRTDPPFPMPGARFNLHWPERGRHDESSLTPDSCADCHPTREDGLGHSVRTYPTEKMALVFAGGQSCATDCHAWLKDAVVATGFEDAYGQVPRYQGSFRPEDLLEAGDNAHADLWQNGAHPESRPMKLGSFNAGCGGCHNVAAESHGTTPSCVSCHKLGGVEGKPLRLKILHSIETYVDVLDVANAGMSPCAYCHREDGAPVERSNAVCYNCHLSGHQPLDTDGKPHFWKTEDR